MFNSASYWEAGYQSDSQVHVDWYCRYQSLKPLFRELAHQPRPSVLVLGSGVSSFPEELYDGGFKRIVCVDASHSAVAAMKQRNDGKRPGLVIVQGNIIEGIQLPDGQKPFDLVIDKGVIDCLLCSATGLEDAVKAVNNVYSLMWTPATWITVSHSPPKDRLDILNSCYWHDTKVKKVPCSQVERATVVNEDQDLIDYEESEDEPAFAVGTAYVYVLVK